MAERSSTPVADAPAVVEFVGQQLKFSEEVRKGVLDHFIMGGQLTAGGVMQAVTSYAQGVDDADLAAELEDSAVDALEFAAGSRGRVLAP